MAIGGLAFGTCQAGRATDAEIRLDAALSAQHDSAVHWQEARQALTIRLGALRNDSGALARQYAAASQAAARARHSRDSLIWLVPDTLRVAVRLAFDSLTGATVACQNLLVNCELRAQNAESRARGDSVQLAQTVHLLVEVREQWHTELARNRPGFLGLRSFWKARQYTLPLLGLSAFLLLRR